MESLWRQFDRLVVFDTETTGIDFGRDEIIEIKHTALSREVFAVGAVDAAAYMAGCAQPGIYDMNDVIASRGK